MIVGLDTSVVVRLLTGEPADQALRALHYVLARRESGDRLLVADWVVAEAYHALQHHYRVPKRATLNALRELLSSPGVEASSDLLEVFATPRLETAKPGFVDRLIHRHYLAQGAERLVTFERAAGKLPGVLVL